MNIQELDSYNLADTVKFHDRLNPRLWDSNEHLRPEVKAKLMQVAQDFQEFLGVPDLDVKDITVSGSNAAFNYTPSSDIDLHLVIDIPNVSHDEVYRELFNAKKYQYNDEHDIRIRDADVELYAQDSAQPHHSQGIYSVMHDKWLSVPKRTQAKIDDVSTRSKFEDLAARIDEVIKSQDAGRMDSLIKKIKTMRQTGLEQQGEFGSDNLAFKLLRNNGYIKRLWDAKKAAKDHELSLAELARPQQRVKYGFVGESPDGVDPTTKMFLEEPATESPDGVNPTTAMFLTEADPESIVSEFIQHTADRLGIKKMPRIHIHRNEDWSKQNHSFGMYVPERHELHVSLGNRHLLDILRTTAHELCHCAQHEQESLPHNAGVTGSDWENEAHAVAGIVMRDFADAHPDYFKMAPVKESASGYIPKNKKEAQDPRYSMAVTVDIKPGQVGKEANKLALHTGRNGEPGLLMKTVNLRESLAAEFEAFGEGKSYGYGSTPLTQEPGGIEDELGNQEATGPEFPPQMPAGTTKIDVSDLTDWYRLGMDISDMDDADPKDYNQGPPQTVIVFPSDEAEQGYLKQFKRLGLKTHDMDPDVKGGEDLTGKHLHQKLAEEFELFEQQDLFEIRMSTSSLRQEAAKTGALAGMEFEMIVPNVQGDPSDFEYEPDYDRDERCRSIEDAVQFFYDGDHNSRRDVEHLREQMNNDYLDWLDGKIEEEWDNDGEEFIEEWVKNNVGEDEWNPDELEGDARNEALEEFAANVHADPMGDYYQQARDEFREERQEGWDESDWLDATDLDRMTSVYNAYSISWPYYTEPGDAGEAEISDVAQDFENAIGRDTWASDKYHSSGTLRPSPERIRYVVEPDASLEGEEPGDRGLEFVSPPLPIDEILSDLNKVKKWAKDYGCYTNDSTGLHINISVPNYSLDRLDFVKLALLMGDKYVLDLFGRSGNTYARSAFDIVKRAVRDFPEEAAKLLDKMKSNLDGLATKAIHSGVTQKYTSINTKDGHIEFRSPGGDWLDQNFDQIENTLLRFTVAMSAALNPEMYRQEYLTKLYKLLSENNKDVDTIKYFSDYVAGKIPKAALRSFVKQAQLERRLKRDPTEGERYWWRVDKEGRGRDGASIELVAASKKEALEKAREEWRIPAGDAAMRRAEAYPLRPYTDTQQADTGGGLTLNGRPSNPDGRYVIVPEQDRQTVYYRFQAAGPDDAAIVLRQWRQEHPGRIWLTLRDDNGVLGQPEGTATPRFGLWDFGEGGFINSQGAVGQGGQLIGGDSFDTAREAARRNGLVSRIDMGEVEIRRIPQEQSSAGTYELFDRRTGEAIPNEEFPARNQGEANTRLQDYIDFGPHGVSQTDAPMAFGVRPVSAAGQQQGQGNWGIYITTLNRFARMPNTTAADNVLRRFSSREAAEQYLATTRGENPRMRTDVEVREIEPELPDLFPELPRRSANQLSQTDIENRLGWGGQAADANYEVVNRATMQPVFKFIANTPEEANTKYAQILGAMGMPPETEDYGYRDIVVPGSTIDLQRRRAAAASDNVFGITGQPSDRTDGRNTNYSFRDLFGNNATADQQQGGIVDVAPDVAQNFPSVGQELRGWKIVDLQGNTLHEFGGVGNVQADANTYALGWLRRNPEHMQTGVEVVPNWVEA